MTTDNISVCDPRVCARPTDVMKYKYQISEWAFGNGLKPNINENSRLNKRYAITNILVKPNFINFVTLLILSFLIWGLLFFALGEQFGFGNDLFKLVITPILGFLCGEILQKITTLPPSFGQLLLGILLRYLNFFNIQEYPEFDSTLRKIYPVIILGKASLGWDIKYMKSEWAKVAGFGVLPWTAEVITLAVSVRYFLEFPWLWGFLFGSIYASLSCAVVLPSVIAQNTEGLAKEKNFPKLVGTAGGVDTTLSVGVFGLLHSFIFYECDFTYKDVKACLTLFIGVALGVIWGSLAKFFPHSSDIWVSELRVLFVLLGGLFGNFCTSSLGWGGTGGVAVLLCNVTAATHWSNLGWTLNKNPASNAYRVLWTIFEAMLFTYTGNHFDVQEVHGEVIINGFKIISLCLFVRMFTTFCLGWSFQFSWQEQIFVCCTWIPKTIVEAVLAPAALVAARDQEETDLGRSILHLTIQLILITTPLGFFLTKLLGPRLLRSNKSLSAA